MRNAHIWTEIEDDLLRKMATAGAMAPDVAKVLKGRTENAIKSRAILLKISLAGPRPIIDEDAFREFMKARGFDGSNGKPDRKVR